MLVVLFSFFVFLICLGVNSFVPAFVVFGVIILFFYVLKAGKLIAPDDLLSFLL